MPARSLGSPRCVSGTLARHSAHQLCTRSIPACALGRHARVHSPWTPSLTSASHCMSRQLLVGRGDDTVSELSMVTLWSLSFCINMRLVLENNSWTVVEVFSFALMFCLLALVSLFVNCADGVSNRSACSRTLLRTFRVQRSDSSALAYSWTGRRAIGRIQSVVFLATAGRYTRTSRLKLLVLGDVAAPGCAHTGPALSDPGELRASEEYVASVCRRHFVDPPRLLS